jgi:GT2 family glycosyltransferase
VNVGAQQAIGEILFFVNPDTVLIQANFLGLAKSFEFRPKAIYGMALIRNDGCREPWSAGQFPSLWRLLLTNIFPGMFSQPWEATSITKTDWVSGAACAIRRDFFLLLGGFDSAYFLYFEDVDLARRGSNSGAWVGIYPFICFRHTGGGSHKETRTKKQAYFMSQKLYFKKWRPGLEWGILSLLHKLIR